MVNKEKGKILDSGVINNKEGINEFNETEENKEDGKKIIKMNKYLHFVCVILELLKLILMGELKEKEEKEGKLGEWKMDPLYYRKRDQKNMDEDEDLDEDMDYVFANKEKNEIKNMGEINEKKKKENNPKQFDVLLADDDLEAFDDFLIEERIFLSTFIKNLDDIEYEKQVEVNKIKKMLIEKYKQQKDKDYSEDITNAISLRKEVHFLIFIFYFIVFLF
jgi:hypothetical protein